LERRGVENEMVCVLKKHYLRGKSVVMKREKVIEAINELPQEFNLDELIEKLVLVEKVELGLKHLDEGKVKDHSTVKEMTKKW